MFGSSLTAVLRERASLQPNDVAFTFIDYEQDWAGVSESLTWSQLYRRSLNIAYELGLSGTTGDRAVILAPQGLDYIAAFVGALQAGQIAVPLSVPVAGVHDERVTAVLSDAAPSTILTTSAFAGHVGEYARAQGGGASTPSVVEVDSVDFSTRKGPSHRRESETSTAYLQYTSGSTRTPAGVVVSHRNLAANFEQVIADLFADCGKVSPPNTTAVSWLPFYHDMGLVLGVCAPILGGWRSVLMSPIAFLARPARWMQLLANNSRALSAGPNFAFELAAARTSSDDMAGLDLGDVRGIICGSERVHAATLQRFTDRFARFNLPAHVIRPSYGLAEATVYAATAAPGRKPNVVTFESEKLSAGHAKRSGSGTPLVSYGSPVSPAVRIVDPETGTERPAGMVGEIWLHGENICAGYWRKPLETEQTFGGTIVSPSAGTPDAPWLRTGDLGFVSDDDLFIIGRIKDLLIVRGRNHYPDDIEATIGEISRGRVAAISVPDDRSEKLVAIVELKNRGASKEDWIQGFDIVKRQVTSAVSTSHGLSIADLVLVQPGSIPITTSGKVRRAACVERYRHEQFTRIDA